MRISLLVLLAVFGLVFVSGIVSADVISIGYGGSESQVGIPNPYIEGFIFISSSANPSDNLCTPGTSGIFNIVLVVGVILILVPLIFFYKQFTDDDWNIDWKISLSLLLIGAIMIFVGLPFLGQAASNAASVCPVGP